MEDMFDFQNMDVSRELASLQFGIDFDDVNILEGLHTPSPSDSLHFGSLAPDFPNEQEQHGGAEVESSLTESGESRNQELGAAASLPTKNPVQELAEGAPGNCEAQINGATSGLSDKPATVAISQVPVDPFADVNAPTQRPILGAAQPKLLSSLEGLVSQGTVPSLQAQLNYSNLLSSQNENMHMTQGTGQPNEHSTNNQMLVQNVVAPNAFSGINQQQYPSYPSLIQQNPAEARVGIGTGILSQGQFTCNQRPPTMWNSSWSQYHQCPPPNVHDSRYVPNFMHYDTPAILRPQQFNTLSQQGSHLSMMQKIFDVQNCMQPPCPTYSRPESFSNYQPTVAPVPLNAYDHQHVHRPILPEPAVPTGPAIYPEYHPQPGPSAMTYYSFGAGPSMPPRYPELRDYQRNHYHSQNMIPNGFAQQALGSAQVSGSPRVSDNRNEHNQLWSTPNVQRQSFTVHGPATVSRIAGSNVQSSRIAEPSRHISITPDASNPSLPGFKTPEPSRFSWTQNAPGIQLQHVAPAATNTFTTNLNRRKLVNPSSSSRPQISEGVRKILNLSAKPKGPKPKATSSSGRNAGWSHTSAPPRNAHQIQIPNFQDPDEIWIKELEMELNKAWNQPDSLTKKQEASRGRRRSSERHEIGESSLSKRQKKDSASKGRDDTPPNSDEARNTSENEGNKDQDANASDPSAVREFLNSVYDLNFERMGLPIDPHIRYFRTAEVMDRMK